MRLANQAKLARAEIVSEICRNQIVRSPAAADVRLGGSGAYQVTVGVKRAQKTRLIGVNIGLDSLQRVFADEKRCFDGAIMSPKLHGMPCGVVKTTVIWKLDHLDLPRVSVT